MSQSYRLSDKGRLDRSQKLTFTYDGQSYTGYRGDTLASALLANGVKLVGRSFKYHRPRGIMSAGSEEPNALVQLETGPRTEPNTRATVVDLYDGLTAASQNCWPSVKFDLQSVNQKIAKLFPAGFYYKTFMFPASWWTPVYEKIIRRAAGLGKSPMERDPDSYAQKFAFCDVLVVGGGPAGIAAALAAGRTGARVILADEQQEMGGALQHSASSINIRERLDFSCAIFNAHGDLVANAPHVPVHLGSMSESVRTILRENEGKIRPGDVFMMNNPFNGGTHLPDVTVITPVFDADGEQIIYTVASRGHHADIGGKTPGSAPPDSRHIDEEGVCITNFLLVKQGEMREAATRELLASGQYPCRNIDDNMADLAAQIAANATGVAELQKITGQFGLETIHAYMGHVQDNAEESVRRVLDVLKDSSFTYPMDDGAKIKVAITVDKAARSATLDFTGTSPQSEFNYNAPLAICRAVVLYVFRTLVGSDIPMNEGCLKPLNLIVPEGSMINPAYPAAVISGNTEVSQSIADTLYGALGVIAGSQGTMNNFVYGNDRYQNYETICGGTGAGEGFDGTSAVHSHMTNTRMTDPEVLETRFPVRVEEFSIRSGSGGQGKWKGGEGITRRLRFNEAMTVTTLTSHRKVRPHGAAGGGDGGVGVNSVERGDGTVERLQGNDQAELQPGDVFVMQTPGGGGYGTP